MVPATGTSYPAVHLFVANFHTFSGITNVQWMMDTPTFYSPPRSTNRASKKPSEENWLPDELLTELDGVKPEDGDIDADGVVNTQRLAAAANQVLYKNRHFFNFHQAYHFTQRFGEPWGMKVTTEGMRIYCAFGTAKKTKSDQIASPSRQRIRATSLTEIDCPWSFTLSAVGPRKDAQKRNIPRIRQQVKIASTNLTHTCDPSAARQTLAKKSGGFYAICPKEMKEIVTLMNGGHVPCTTLRNWLRARGGIPPTSPITGRDLWNFWRRAILYSQRDSSEFKNNEVHKLIGCKGLDTSEEHTLGHMEVAALRCADILRNILQGTESGWVLKEYLQGLKDEVPGFDYRVARDTQGRPTGAVWITQTMRESWIRYGDLLFLDAKKKPLNKLEWPYIGPVGVDNENKVVGFCEALVLEESHEAYKFVMDSLFEMELHRPRESLILVFGDLFITQNLLDELKLSAGLFWDHHHLTTQVWPKELTDVIYAGVAKFLVQMLNAVSRAKYDEAFLEVEKILRPRPAKLAYIRSFYNKPHNIALFHILTVRGSMRKRGGSHAEQNHSSIESRISKGAAMEPEVLVKMLLDRQGELVATRKSRAGDVLCPSQTLARGCFPTKRPLKSIKTRLH
jgi:hypothetical protein